MIESWRSQDQRPLYGVNADLLRLTLRHEQADLRRALRWEYGTNYVVGAAMTGLAGAVLWWFLAHRGHGLHLLYLVGAAIALGAFALWVASLWVTRRRQALRERGFGNTLQEEVRRSLSLVDFQLSQVGRWSTALLWSAPVLVGSVLTFWLIVEINDNTGFWFDAGFIAFMVVSIAATTYDSSRRARRALEPRRQRLVELLAMLDGR
ncbi:MAG: hypothetical protein R3B09_02530 [Nannocystaceae bacterium]